METVIIEAVKISTVGSPCEELYSDIRAGPFDVLTGHFHSFNVNFPKNHPTLSCNSDENFSSADAEHFQILNPSVIKSMYLNTETDKQGDMCLLSVHAVGRSPHSNFVKITDGSGDILTKRASASISSHSRGKINASSRVYPVFMRIKENDLGDSSVNRLCGPNRDLDIGKGTSEEENDLGDSFLSSFYDATRNLDVGNKSVEICHKGNDSVDPSYKSVEICHKENDSVDLSYKSVEICHKENDSVDSSYKSVEICHKENDSVDSSYKSVEICHKENDLVDSSYKSVEINHKEMDDNGEIQSSSVEVNQTKVVVEATHMSFDDDICINFNRNNSFDNSSSLKTNIFVYANAFENVTLESEEHNSDKDKMHEKRSLTAEAQENIFLQSERTGNNFSTSACSSKPSHRSLTVKTDQQAKSLLSCQLSSGDAKMKKSKISKANGRNGMCKVKLYTCNICDTVCKERTDLEEHKQTHIVSKINKCGFVCKQKAEMRKHKVIHGTECLYRCTECGYSSKRLKYLKKHMRIHSGKPVSSYRVCDFRPKCEEVQEKNLHDHSNLKTHSCVECDDSFSEVSVFKDHMMKQADNFVSTQSVCSSKFEENDLSKKPGSLVEQGLQEDQLANCSSETAGLGSGTNFPENNDSCEHQGNNILNRNTVENRIINRNVHIEDCNKNTAKERQISSRTYQFITVKGKPLQCTMCSYSHASKNALTHHMILHSDNKTGAKPHCGASFKRKDSMKIHKLTQKDLRPFKCSLCVYKTHCRRRLRIHVLVHKNKKSFVCSLCVFRCKKEYELQNHIKNKHGIEPETESLILRSQTAPEDVVLKCDLCDYTCDSYKRLKYHLTRHKNKTPHHCPHCEYKCSSRSSLADHLLRHAGIKPCLCSECGLAFRNTSRLNRHKLVHSDVKPYRCSFCEFSSRSKYNLKQHTLRHTDQRKARSRNRKSSKPDVIISTGSEITRQEVVNSSSIEAVNPTFNTEVQSLVNLMTTNFHLDKVQSHRNDNYLTCDAKNILDITETFKESVISQYVTRNEVNITSDNCKDWDRIMEQNSSPVFSTVYQSADLTMNPCHLDRTYYPNIMNQTQIYSDPYSDLNPFLGHAPSSILYSANVCSRQTNSDFCYVERNDSGYGFANPYFYNDTVFPGSLNPNMAFYVYPNSNNGCTLTPALSTSTSQNMFHLNQPTNEIAFSALPQQPAYDVTVSSLPQQPINDISVSLLPQQSSSEITVSVLPQQPANEIIVSFLPQQPANETTVSFLPQQPANETTVSFLPQQPANETTVSFLPQQPANETTVSFLQQQAANEITFSFLPQQSADEIAISLLPQQLEPSSVTVEHNPGQDFPEVASFHTDNFSVDEDILKEVPVTQFTEASKPAGPRSQAKMTGATLKGRTAVKDSLGDNTVKPTHVCSECGYICLTNTMLQRHKTTHVDLKPFKCDDCGKTFKRADHMKAHRRTHGQSKPHSCKHCSYTCSRKYQLKLHEATHSVEHSFSCSVCDGRFDLEQELEDHMNIHLDGNMFACSKCDFRCKDKTQLKSHQHDPKSFLCVICSYVCRSAREFNSHKRMHGKKDELLCSVCSYTCDSQKRLKYHMKRHENKTPYECPHCDYRCSSRSSLSDHLLHHEGLKPFLCSVCGMKFRNVSRLNRHRLIHTDFKPHTCDYCSFSSRSRYNLKQHVLRHFK